MKKSLLLAGSIATGIALIFLAHAWVDAAPKKPAQVQKIVTLKVEGMTCMGCQDTVEKAIHKIPGVIAAKVSHDENRAVIQGTRELDARKLIESINKTHYKASFLKEEKSAKK
ncbi:MAG: heavy-metal-associated domain-containing protein [Armatimonadetes bacterium]|nr:heavy-metal-associated domain-containing protein [Armatimonadota bacterium]